MNQQSMDTKNQTQTMHSMMHEHAEHQDTMPAKKCEMKKSEKSIVETLKQDPRFSKLVAALSQHKGLVDDIAAGKNLTLFAPTNKAFEHIEREMQSMGKEDIESILRYHCLMERVAFKDMRDGMTLRTTLKLKSLNNEHQRIRIFRCGGTVSLNMLTRVSECDMEAANGVIHVIDRVMMLPKDMLHSLSHAPSRFSTWLLAVERTGMSDKLREHAAMTCFIPENSAWSNLQMSTMAYLFGCPEGEKDLKRIVEYHMSPELVYADSMIEKKHCQLKTMLKDTKVEVEVVKMNCEMLKMGDCGKCECVSEKKQGGMNPNCYRMSLNKGEARIIFKDAVCMNGCMMVVSDLMIPDGVSLGDVHMRD